MIEFCEDEFQIDYVSIDPEDHLQFCFSNAIYSALLFDPLDYSFDNIAEYLSILDLMNDVSI